MIWRLLLVFECVFFAAASAVPGGENSAHIQQFRQQAEVRAVKRFDRLRLDAEELQQSQFYGFDQLEPEMQQALAALLLSNSPPADQPWEQWTEKLSEQSDQLAAVWAETREKNQTLTQQILSVEEQLAKENTWRRYFHYHWPLMLSGLGALAVLLAVIIHQRRWPVRKSGHLSGRLRLAAIVWLGAVAAVLILGLKPIAVAPPPEPETVEPFQPSEVENIPFPQRLDAWEKTESQPEPRLGRRWAEMQRRLREFSVRTAVLQDMSEAYQEDSAKWKADRNTLHTVSAELHSRRSSRSIVMLVSGIGWLLGLSVLGGWHFLRKRKKQKTTEQTCPLCFETGTLKPHREEGETLQKPAERLHCVNVISHDPYEECNFQFYSRYQPMPKLCFPLLGHPRAGKTHWLSMVYRELNRGNYQSRCQFERVHSESSDDFDRTVDQILHSRMDPERTQTAMIPRPLLFNFRDRDPWGRTNVLLSLFDYSGEVVAAMTLEDSQRRRALQADGYLFFLDPTEFGEPQAQELVNFREDVRILQQSRPGAKLQIPVAICVSKIDLLVNHHSQNLAETFYQELKKIDPSGEELSLSNMQARSKLIQGLQDDLWPGWSVEREIQNLFGDRHLFFPLTPVGLTELGETDLSRRTIEPFGILEPLLWLLQMNGHPVLKS